MMERPGRDPAPAAPAGWPTPDTGSAAPGGCRPLGFSPGAGLGDGGATVSGLSQEPGRARPRGFVFTPCQQLQRRMIKDQRG